MKKVYQRDDIFDINFVDNKRKINLERMQEGLASIGVDGKYVELHHLTQRDFSNVAEITKTIHIKLNTVTSSINRQAFGKFRNAYWEERVKGFIT